MQEEHVANCLDTAFKTNIPKQQRKAKVAKSADWLVMEKKWRSILTLALDEMEIPGDDDDSISPKNQRMLRRRSRGSSPKSALDWLPDNDTILAGDSDSDAFRLATLLINKQLKRGDWNDELSALENSIRQNCLTDGVDQVWHILGQKTALLAQFVAFPVAKKKSKSTKKIDIGVGRIDVFDNSQLSVAISKLSPLCVDANQQIAIQKVQSQISAKRSIEASKELLNLTGDAAIISVILAIVGNNDSDKAIKELAKVDKSLAEEFTDLVHLSDGEIKDWEFSKKEAMTG